MAGSPVITETQPDAYRSVVGEADAELDQRLSDELDVVNAAATVVTPAVKELTVRVSETLRWEGVPTADASDVHFRKEL